MILDLLIVLAIVGWLSSCHRDERRRKALLAMRREHELRTARIESILYHGKRYEKGTPS